MSKRLLSAAPLPPSKRLHTTTTTTHTSSTLHSNFDAVFYDEIVLVIFSYLSWSDLCAIQPTNRSWSRLSLDNQLWKVLYLGEYGRARLRGVRGYIGRTDGRDIRPLPGRAKSDDIKDWKWMFRISSNWRTGRCSVQPLATSISQPPSAILLDRSDSPMEQKFVLLAGNLTITASSRRLSIVLTTPTHEVHTIPYPSRRAAHITALALDQSPPSSTHHFGLVSFLSSGEFSVFSIDHRTPANSSRLLTYVPAAKTPRTSPITQAVYHHPLLITLSQSFHLSLYDLSGNSITHTQTLSSFTSHPPSSLVLSTPAPGTYKLILAYAIPVYPAHWSVGATELLIGGGGATVTGTRTARAIDVPQGWIDRQKLRAVREQWARKVARVADTQTDGKWVVLAPGEPPASSSSVPSGLHSSSGLQLYRLYLPASASAASAPKLTFVRTLHGQMGPVSALSLADGRCVSLGANRGIWVWDLETGTGAEVSSGTAEALAEARSVESADELTGQDSTVKGTVVFDERRIISADASGVHVRRFDI